MLITKDSEAWDDIGVPALVTETADDLLSGYHLALLRPFKEILGAYLVRTLPEQRYAYQFHIRATTVTRYGLTHTGIKSICIPLPPLPEQAAIVRYLDHVDRRIRRYVSAKRKLIALLEEEKQAVVSQAVTRGLDPNVRLKPSGVEWLGDVPEHWEVRRLKALVTTGTGGRDTINRKEDGLYPFFVRSQTVERIDTWSFDGDHAVLTAGDGVGVGKVFHYVNGKFEEATLRVYNIGSATLGTSSGNSFSTTSVSTSSNEVSLGTAKSTVDSLRLPMAGNLNTVALLTTIPPLEEQSHRRVRGRSHCCHRRRHRPARRQIELLQEYRTGSSPTW